MDDKIPFLFVFAALSVVHMVSCHSWLACTDYAEKNAAYYDHSKCRGYARSALRMAPKGETFGADKGYNFQPQPNQPACRDPRNDMNEYDATHPMAVYYQGQQVVLAHPMKNHGSDTCTNAYIPDNGNYIYRGEKDATSDPSLNDFRKNLVANLGVKDILLPYDQYPKPGYQNAPKFCENTDKSLGTYSFNVPSDLAPGQYTFYWLWGFNSENDLYSSCFEVKIVATREERNAALLSNGFDDFYEPCGGKTSDFSVKGNTNLGCTNASGVTGSPETTSPTQSTTTISTTPTAATPTSTVGPGQTMLSVQTVQMAGHVDLPELQSETARRFISVQWDCPVTANFWNVRVIARHDQAEGTHYELMQEGQDIDQRKFFYHASFKESCNLLAYPPVAKLIRDEI